MAPKKTTTVPTAPVTPAVTAVPAASAATKKGRSPPRASAPAPEPVPVVPTPVVTPVDDVKTKKRTTKAVSTPVVPAPSVASGVDAPKKRVVKPKAVENSTSVILNAKPATTPSGETVTLTKTKRVKKEKDPNATPRNSAYNDYMKKYMAVEKARIQASGEKVDHKLVFKTVAANWKTSSEYKTIQAAKALI